MPGFDSLVTPRPLEANTFAVDLPDGWHQGRGLFGGLILAAMARAAEAVGGAPDRRLRSMTADVFDPVQPGPTTLRTEILKAGSGQTNVAVRLLQGDALRATASFCFGKPRVTDGTWTEPTVSPPDWKTVEVVEVAPPIGPEFAQHLEYRLIGPPPFAEGPTARAEGFIRFKEPGIARDAAFIIGMMDAWWPAAFARMAMPRPMATASFALEWVNPLGNVPADAPLYFRSHAPAAADGYTVELRELWTPDGRLVAYNQQTFVIIK